MVERVFGRYREHTKECHEVEKILWETVQDLLFDRRGERKRVTRNKYRQEVS